MDHYYNLFATMLLIISPLSRTCYEDNKVHVLLQSSDVKILLELQVKHSGYIGAICAAPLALKYHGILCKKVKMTSHPLAKSQFEG